MSNITARVRSLASRRAVLAGVAVSAVCVWAAPAFSQMVCMAREKIVERLADGYAERPAAVGIAHNGAIIELFTSDKGTFTVILTRPHGVSCLMAVGHDWQKIPARSASPVAQPQL